MTPVTFAAVGTVRTTGHRFSLLGFRFWVGSLFTYIKVPDWNLCGLSRCSALWA